MADSSPHWITYAGLLIGAIGFAYGIWKDFALRVINRRASGPYFIVHSLLGMWKAWGGGSSKDSCGYVFPSLEEAEMYGLNKMEEISELPPAYPSNLKAGLRIKNTGSRLRSYKLVSHTFRLERYSRSEELYDFIYTYSPDSRNKPVKVKLKFETEAGIVDTQIWRIYLGTSRIERVRPKQKI